MQINFEGKLLYPLPPIEPIALEPGLKAANSAYVITSLRVVSKNTINFGWSIPDNPCKNHEWWAVYTGVLPGWTNLKSFKQFGYICPKHGKQGETGTKTVNVGYLVPGAIYTLVLFKWKWSVVDYQEFTAP